MTVDNTYQLASGIVLELVRPNPKPIQKIMAELAATLGADAVFNFSAENMSKLSPTQQLAASVALVPMFEYCLGWGIANTPPDNLEIYKMLGLKPHEIHLKRAAWIQEVATEEEQAEIMGMVLTRTMAPTAPRQVLPVSNGASENGMSDLTQQAVNAVIAEQKAADEKQRVQEQIATLQQKLDQMG